MSSKVSNKVDLAEGGKVFVEAAAVVAARWPLSLTTMTSIKERGAPWDYDEGSFVQGDKK